MRARSAVGVALVAAALLLPTSATSGRQKPYVLTALANIGTVYWRYDCAHYRQPEWSLGLRWDGDASTLVTYRAGHLARHRWLPKRTFWFPFRKNVLQSLAFVQAIEPGTLRARVTVDWRHDHGGDACQSYFPPRLTVQIYPRG